MWGKNLFPQVQKNGSVDNTIRALGAAWASGMMVIYVNIAWRPGFPELPTNTCGLLKEAKEKNECLVGSRGRAICLNMMPPNDPPSTVRRKKGTR